MGLRERCRGGEVSSDMQCETAKRLAGQRASGGRVRELLLLHVAFSLAPRA